MEETITPFQRLAGQAGEHHQIDMAPIGMAPLPKFRRQGPLLESQGLGVQVLKALVHQIEAGANQLGRFRGGHDWTQTSQKRSTTYLLTD
jgi:hypothetical protein